MADIEFSKETRQDMLNEIREFFLNERDEDISEFQAGAVLDFFLAKLGPFVYNQAISDAVAFMNGRVEELYGLEKRGR